jgi:hypothetical protein
LYFSDKHGKGLTPKWTIQCGTKFVLAKWAWGAKVVNRRLGGRKLVENPLDQKEDDGAGSPHNLGVLLVRSQLRTYLCEAVRKKRFLRRWTRFLPRERIM